MRREADTSSRLRADRISASRQNVFLTQREVDVDTRSFAEALRSALRQDPDVILVGEMRDHETIETALTVAETGHLVLSTLHTLDATETITRIVSSFPSRTSEVGPNSACEGDSQSRNLNATRSCSKGCRSSTRRSRSLVSTAFIRDHTHQRREDVYDPAKRSPRELRNTECKPSISRLFHLSAVRFDLLSGSTSQRYQCRRVQDARFWNLFRPILILALTTPSVSRQHPPQPANERDSIFVEALEGSRFSPVHAHPAHNTHT